jgi:hypothetical protein
VPGAKAPTKAEAVLTAFDEVGVDAPLPRIQAALAARGLKVSDNYVYDLKKVYRKRKGVAAAPARAGNGKPARKAAPRKSAVRKAAPKAPAAPARPAEPAAAPVVEAVQTAQHLLALVGKADAHRLLDMLAAE